MVQSICNRVAHGVMTVGAAILSAAMAAVLVGCGESDPVAPAPVSVSSSVTATAGPDSGTVTGPDDVQVEIPQGALSTDTTIGITCNLSGAPSLIWRQVTHPPVRSTNLRPMTSSLTHRSPFASHCRPVQWLPRSS